MCHRRVEELTESAAVDSAAEAVAASAEGTVAAPSRARLLGPQLSTRAGAALGLGLTALLTAALLLVTGVAESPPSGIAPGGALSGADAVSEGDLARPPAP